MKNANLSLILVVLSVAATAAASAETSTGPVLQEKQGAPQSLYLHGFRSPSVGAEYRIGQIGIHAGYYPTIFDRDGGKTTEFLKAGVTVYLGGGAARKQEMFVSGSYVRGQNRAFDGKNGFFFEFGNRFKLGGNWEARLGTGVLFSESFKARLNPTVGISYRVKI